MSFRIFFALLWTARSSRTQQLRNILKCRLSISSPRYWPKCPNGPYNVHQSGSRAVARFHGRSNSGLSNVFWHRTLMHTVRYGFNSIPTERFGEVFRNHKTYGAVRCGFEKYDILRCGSARFSDVVNPTVRSVAVFKGREPYGAVRCDFHLS